MIIDIRFQGNVNLVTSQLFIQNGFFLNSAETAVRMNNSNLKPVSLIKK
jgi:hypothetical protein